MKIKRFVASDMRAALIQVKDELGADAVILSNKKTKDGIEIVAAMDYDDQEFLKTNEKINRSINNNNIKIELTEPADLNPIRQKNVANNKQNAEVDSLSVLVERQQQRRRDQSQEKNKKDVNLPKWAQGLKTDNEKKIETKIASVNKRKPAVSYQDLDEKTPSFSKNDIGTMRKEINSLRNLLIFQCSNLLAQEKHRQDPLRATLEARLNQGGFSAKISAKLAGLSQKYTPHQLAKILPKVIANAIEEHGDNIINDGGIVSLIGPTGVGKTTTIAKLAARFIDKYRADDLILLTTDHYRIGAFEQLDIYGKIMGCQVKKVTEDCNLSETLNQYKSKKLVLIDTPGVGQKDRRLYQQLDVLSASNPFKIKNYLVLSATSQQKVIEDAVMNFKRVTLAGTIITKLDEAVSIAGILSTLIHNHLRVSYTTDGQRVPEDLHKANSLELAHLALDAVENVEASFLTGTVWMGDLNHATE